MTGDKPWILGTRNPHKVKEIRDILGLPESRLISALDVPTMGDVEETGSTLEDNALIKARAAYAHTGLFSIADDTGLEVDALNGAPGVVSARFAGPEGDAERNIDKLLSLMQDVDDAQRTARFRCVVALAGDFGETWVDGICEGRILRQRKGSEGFGYDPVFYVPEEGCTFAEMTAGMKNRISHRGRAFRNLKTALQDLGLLGPET